MSWIANLFSKKKLPEIDRASIIVEYRKLLKDIKSELLAENEVHIHECNKQNHVCDKCGKELQASYISGEFKKCIACRKLVKMGRLKTIEDPQCALIRNVYIIYNNLNNAAIRKEWDPLSLEEAEDYNKRIDKLREWKEVKYIKGISKELMLYLLNSETSNFSCTKLDKKAFNLDLLKQHNIVA